MLFAPLSARTCAFACPSFPALRPTCGSALHHLIERASSSPALVKTQPLRLSFLTSAASSSRTRVFSPDVSIDVLRSEVAA